MFAHLETHSCYSFLSGADRPEALLDAAAGHGYSTLGLTDKDGLYGAVAFVKAARERGIHPIVGTVLDDGRERATLLARDRSGYSALCRLVSAFHLEKNFRLEKSLPGEMEHLVVITGSETLIRNLSGRDWLYVRVPMREDASGRAARTRARALAEHYHLPTVLCGGVHFATREGYGRNGSLQAARAADRDAWLLPPAEVEERFGAQWSESIDNTTRIAEVCDCQLELGRPRFPQFPLPNGETPFSMLYRTAFAGAVQRYRPLRRDVTRRLEYELDVIEKLGFAGYFLIVWDIVKFARDKGIPTIGRGSAAGSLVAYALGMTNVDPLEHNLMFERFLNPQRQDPPDIDIDLCWKRRPEVLQYVYDRYGNDRVAMISTHATFGARQAMRDAAKAHGIDEGEINQVCKKLPWGSLKKALANRENWPLGRHLNLDCSPWKEVVEAALGIDGLPNHLSVHAGGIVVSPGPLTDYLPLERSAGGLQVAQYEMRAIEDLGLLKIDLLGQRSLSVVADCVKVVEETEKKKLDMDGLPSGDAATLALLNRGDSMGCFQIESPGMRSLLRKLDVAGDEILIAAISVIRPGPADAGMMRHFVDRHNGREAVEYLHPHLETLLRETYGIMLYQEDILKVAHKIASMDLGEADLLRRAMTKKRNAEAMDKSRERFLSGADRLGYNKDIVEKIWQQVSSFAGYAFCKAHSAAYARLSYQAAWLKAHYPAPFMAAVLANGGGFYHPAAYVEEARRMGLEILLPHINKSDDLDVSENRGIRLGLGRVKNFTRKTLGELLQERKSEPFTSLSNFLARVKAGKTEMENLIRCGVFDPFEETRPELLWKLELLFESSRKRERGQSAMFELAPFSPATELLPRIPDYTLSERLRAEQEILGLAVSSHPTALYADLYEAGGLIKATQMPRRVGQRAALLGKLLTSKPTTTKSGESMRFLTLEDDTGLFEVVLFPKTYKAAGYILSQPGPYIAMGKVEEDCGCVTLTAQRLETVDNWKRRHKKASPEVQRIA
jgi:DNA polymerase III subunit alpha